MVAGREGRGRVTYGREERGQNGIEGGREIDAGKGEGGGWNGMEEGSMRGQEGEVEGKKERE